MSMEHKAFVFDYEAFSHELRDILMAALRTRDAQDLVAFIQSNLPQLSDPDDGSPLPADWLERLRTKDVQQFGDIALTKYYGRTQDIGLGYDWQEALELLNQETGDGRSVVLGEEFGPPDNRF